MDDGPVSLREEGIWLWRVLWKSFLVFFVVFFVFPGAFWFLFPPMSGIKYAPQSCAIQETRTIAVAMFEYANDNSGNYPDGQSSTEVFQKLLNGNYVNDPSIFYLPARGRVKPVSGQPLKPENVSYDVTGGLGPDDSDGVPVVFLTGYKVNYIPGGSAIPLTKPYPVFGTGSESWSDWWSSSRRSWTLGPGIAATDRSNSARWRPFDDTQKPDGAVPNFVPAHFDAKGKTYRQLGPEGVVR